MMDPGDSGMPFFEKHDVDNEMSKLELIPCHTTFTEFLERKHLRITASIAGIR